MLLFLEYILLFHFAEKLLIFFIHFSELRINQRSGSDTAVTSEDSRFTFSFVYVKDLKSRRRYLGEDSSFWFCCIYSQGNNGSHYPSDGLPTELSDC